MKFNNIYKGKKILITGNTGFKGSWLTIWLLKLGAEVYGISNDVPSNPSIFEKLNLKEKIIHFNQDIRDLNKIKEIITNIKPDFCFHLAAQPIVSKSFENPIETLTTNIIGTANILESLRKSNNNCVTILITSDKSYDNIESKWGYREDDKLGGKDPYSASKASAELVIKTYFNSFFNNPESKIKIASARAGNVIGGGDWAKDRIVPDCIRSWNISQPVNIRNPQATRPWQHVLEPLSGYLRLGQILSNNTNINGEPYNFGPESGQTQTVLQLLQDMSKHWNFLEPKNAYNIVSENKFAESKLLKLCCDKALFDLQWKPTLTYDETVKLTSVWYYTYYRENQDMFEYTINQINQYEQLAQERQISRYKKHE